jgi:hypothetical protein
MSSPSLLPFQPVSMTTAQLAAEPFELVAEVGSLIERPIWLLRRVPEVDLREREP